MCKYLQIFDKSLIETIQSVLSIYLHLLLTEDQSDIYADIDAFPEIEIKSKPITVSSIQLMPTNIEIIVMFFKI